MKKEFINWKKEWETGIKKIDEQHKHFVGIINQVDVLNEDGKEKDKLEPIINDLMEYARVHFSTEEGYFDDTDYPDTDEHKEKHQELLGKVINFGNRFKNEEEVSQVVKELLIFLKDWLDEHLIEYDHKYVPWLTEHGIK